MTNGHAQEGGQAVSGVKAPTKRRYINPGSLTTRVTDNYGFTYQLAPWEDKRVGAFRNRKTFVVELEKDFGDKLCRTGQIAPAPKDVQLEDADEDEATRRFREAREAAIEEQRQVREKLMAQREFDSGPLTADQQLDRGIERLNTVGDEDDDPPELDMEHATPPVEQVTKGNENLTHPAEADDLKSRVGGTGMSRKKKPKTQ